jgi:hypothetical protein
MEYVTVDKKRRACLSLSRASLLRKPEFHMSVSNVRKCWKWDFPIKYSLCKGCWTYSTVLAAHVQMAVRRCSDRCLNDISFAPVESNTGRLGSFAHCWHHPTRFHVHRTLVPCASDSCLVHHSYFRVHHSCFCVNRFAHSWHHPTRFRVPPSWFASCSFLIEAIKYVRVVMLS